MASKLTQEILNWANLENISKPMTPHQIKTFAAVLTRKVAHTQLAVIRLLREDPHISDESFDQLGQTNWLFRLAKNRYS